MDDKDPTSVIQMINDLKSGSGRYRSSSEFALRLSGSVVPMTLMENSTDGETPRKRVRLDSTSSSMNRTSGESALMSPWEMRRLKGEVVSLRTRLSHQEANVQQLHKIRRQMEEVFDKEKSVLKMQAELDKQTIKQLEARIDAARRSAQEAQEGQTAVERELSELRTRLEEKIVALTDENAKLAEKQRQSMETAENSPPKSSKDPEYEDERTILLEKLEISEARILELEEKLQMSLASQQEMEVQSIELQNAKMTIQSLESDRGIWEEAKSFANRATRASELERELSAAYKSIAAMRESVKGKLLLEEEIRNMHQRIEHMDKLEEHVAKLESEKSELLRKLGKYENIGFNGDPTALKTELNRLQISEAVLTGEDGQLRSKIDSLQRENANLTKKYDEVKKIVTDTTTSNERINKHVNLLQKKVVLVTRERDSYRQQLDLYEKENTNVDSNSAITERIPALERALESYRDLVAKLEVDLGAMDTSRSKEECQKLRDEVERLKGELEHRALKGDFNSNARILHFTMNPAAIASQLAEEKQQALIREVEELRARVEMGGGSTTVGVSSSAQEIAELKQTHEIKIARLKDAFRVSSQEYRQACYQLFGWRVDRTKEGEYKLFSQYAESPDDFLFFRVGESGVDMLETNFSATLDVMIERHLERQHSVPMFINAVQCDLFAQQTITSVV